MAKKASREIQQLFLRLLNFTPELLDKIQAEAKLQNTSFDAVVRAAVEKHLNDLTVARSKDAETEYGHLLLQAHFADDRNEFLSEDAIRAFGRGVAKKFH